MNRLFLLVMLCPMFAFGQSFHPAAGNAGTNAIYKDSNVFVAWANAVYLERGYLNAADTNYEVQGSNKVTFGQPSNALGMAEGNSSDIVSLGDGGVAVLMFQYSIIDGPGYDFAVFENSFTDTYLELAHVAVSSDGVNYVTFESTSETSILQQTGPFDYLQPEYLNNLAGKYRAGFGVPFDLNELAGSPLLDLQNIQFVRITDVVGSIDPFVGSMDAQGTMINDPYPTPFESGGFDLDAVGVINHVNTANIEEFQFSFRAYPNPTKGQFRIEFKKKLEGEIEVVNAIGQVVLQRNFSSSELELKLPESNGIYLVRVYSKGRMIQKRILKQD